MASTENTVIGFAKQALKGTPIVADAAFTYVLFTEGTGIAPNPINLPLDKEVGGGAMLRDVLKVGVFSGGSLSFIPRPKSLGFFLHGAFGAVTTAPAGSGFTHTFKLGADQFDAPYYTGRSAPGNLWGEQGPDIRFNALALNWKGANFLRGDIGMVGGTPEKVSTAAWAAAAKIDGGAPFITPTAKIEVPDATALSVLQGSFVARMAIPLDEQFVVGSYSPKSMDIVDRQYMLSLLVQVESPDLYKKIMYDPAGGSTWVADMFREGDIDISFKTANEIDPGVFDELTIQANGQAGDAGNVVWTAQPLGFRAGRIVTMAITGTFLATPTGDPIVVTLTNEQASY